MTAMKITGYGLVEDLEDLEDIHGRIDVYENIYVIAVRNI